MQAVYPGASADDRSSSPSPRRSSTQINGVDGHAVHELGDAATNGSACRSQVTFAIEHRRRPGRASTSATASSRPTSRLPQEVRRQGVTVRKQLAGLPAGASRSTRRTAATTTLFTSATTCYV
ncbi:MAG: hypothetical protein MZW92_78545 [Comamonadaceae bacterium]|nr:hypothetical protein [Comamonadaceae bacterium]